MNPPLATVPLEDLPEGSLSTAVGPPSKNAQKRARKAARFAERKLERRAREKEARKEKKRLRESASLLARTWNMTAPAKGRS